MPLGTASLTVTPRLWGGAGGWGKIAVTYRGAYLWTKHYALWEKLKPLARQMRHAPTPAEHLLWQKLRHHALNNTQFRRQHVINRFIVDFYCASAKLVVEVDGSVHEYTVKEDAIRQQFLEEVHGLTVLRFSNSDVLGNIDVLEAIGEYLSPNPSP